MITPSAPPSARRVKKYQLLVTVSYTHHGAGTALVSHIFGDYNSLEECKEAGVETKNNHTSAATYIAYTCIPVYRMV